MNAREERGLVIAATQKLTQKGKVWLVPSQSGRGKYTVAPDPECPFCSCPDHEETGGKCKHIYAVECVVAREQRKDGTVVETRTLTLTQKKTYRQPHWPALAKLHEHCVRCRPFFEADLHHQMTALATEPVFGATRRLFRTFPLLNPGQPSCSAAGRPHPPQQSEPFTHEGGLTMQVFQSRWGFHPCDCQVFLKLKRIHKAYWEGLRKLAAWRRWQRKLPANRVLVRWHRDEAGRKIKREIIGPRPEPLVSNVYREICQPEISIPQEFDRARHGRPREQVVPLAISPDVIGRWCDELLKEDSAG